MIFFFLHARTIRSFPSQCHCRAYIGQTYIGQTYIVTYIVTYIGVTYIGQPLCIKVVHYSKNAEIY